MKSADIRQEKKPKHPTQVGKSNVEMWANVRARITRRSKINSKQFSIATFFYLLRIDRSIGERWQILCKIPKYTATREDELILQRREEMMKRRKKITEANNNNNSSTEKEN